MGFTNQGYMPTAGRDPEGFLQQYIAHGGNDVGNAANCIDAVIDRGLWRRPTDIFGRPFGSFREYVDGRLRVKVSTLLDLFHSFPDLCRKIEDAYQGSRGNPTGNNQHTDASGNRSDVPVSTGEPSRGNSRVYLSTRLRKQRPDLYARVEAGELSVRAAAIEAGFVKAPLTGIDRIKADMRRLSSDEFDELMEWARAGRPE